MPVPYQYHVFICTNEREAGHRRGCCASRGSGEVLNAFKAEVVRLGLTATVRAQKAGCLEACEEGVAVVIYPEGVWYSRVQPEQVPEIVESHLKNGKPVEKFRMDYERLRRAQAGLR